MTLLPLVAAVASGAGCGALLVAPLGRPVPSLARPPAAGAAFGERRRGRRLDLPSWVRLPLLALACAVPAALLAGPVLGLLAAPLPVALGRVRTARRSSARRIADADAAVEMLRALAVELRAGRPPAACLADVVELAPATVRPVLSAAVNGGAQELPDRLGLAAAVTRAPWVHELAACWSVCDQLGAPLAEVVGRLADVAAGARAARRELDTALAGPRASARLVAGLPVLGVVFAGLLGTGVVRLLLHSAVGAACLVVGLSLDLLGLRWTALLVRRAERGGGPS